MLLLVLYLEFFSDLYAGETVDGEEGDEDEDIDEWLIDQEIPSSESADLLNAPKYGFGNLTQGVFNQVKVITKLYWTQYVYPFNVLNKQIHI